ncbi:MAG: hypothetical protein ABSD74_04600 [Rhizomicrobium sp.]
MELTFEIDGTSVKFSRDWFTGRCTLNTGSGDEILESLWNPATHFSVKLTRRWQRSIKGHDIVIEKVRPLLLAGFRRQTYRLFIDGQLVEDRKGF